MVVRIVSVKKDGTTTVQYHDPATNTYTKTQTYSSTKDAYSSKFYHAFDGTPAFYSPVEDKVDKSWVHSSHSSSSHSSSNSSSQTPVFMPIYYPPPQQPTQPPQQPQPKNPQTPQQTGTTGTIIAIVVGVIILVGFYYYMGR